MSSAHIVVRQAPAQLRPFVVKVLREGVRLVPTGDPAPLGVMIRREWVGWPRIDKLRLTVVFAWTAAFLLTQINDPEEREQFLNDLEAL